MLVIVWIRMVASVTRSRLAALPWLLASAACGFLIIATNVPEWRISALWAVQQYSWKYIALNDLLVQILILGPLALVVAACRGRRLGCANSAVACPKAPLADSSDIDA